MIKQFSDEIYFWLFYILILPDRIRKYADDQYAANYNYYDFNYIHYFFPIIFSYVTAGDTPLPFCLYQHLCHLLQPFQ